ncbi:2-polyprenyl-6-methoxyphenol hydroxylase-like FAD-dependent oxidoreductase [Variovorax paradoxus]|uniref:FAD-dependent oxidoreductase n=1 Tax=Variovorax paradoxus TaxID=34073 RepID=UPI0033941DF2
MTSTFRPDAGRPPLIATDVLIAGGGPCGLMLANELGRRGIRCLLVDAKPGTAFNPQANATQARTMEHFRRLGFAHEIRALGLPADHPTDIAYFTRLAGHELARISLPTAAEAAVKVKSMTGSWSAAELPHRVSQKFVEQALRRHAQAWPSADVRYGWRLERFSDEGGSVSATVRSSEGGPAQDVVAKFLIGADGARSLVRQQLGIEWGGVSGIQREFMGGKMFAIYLRAPRFVDVLRHPKAWMYVAVNHERRAFMASVDGVSEYAFHAALRPGEDADDWTEADARRVFAQAVGADVPIEILSMGTWLAGHALVAQRFQQGRVFIAGDAAHLFTPTGGLGYNTAVEDAVNLGWKLASVIRGQAPLALLDSYEAERRPLAERNTGYARKFADSVGLFAAKPELEETSQRGDTERKLAGLHFDAHARLEFNIPGVTFGGRYDGSPIILGDGTVLPPDEPNAYTPTASPGGRPPHAWLDDGRSLFDLFHAEWTLLALGPDAPATEAFEAAARDLEMDLRVVRLPQPSLRELYEAPLALIRPDQIVAWRGAAADDAASVLSRVTARPCPAAPHGTSTPSTSSVDATGGNRA